LESLTIAKRRSLILLTNDKRVRNFCQSEGVVVYDLPMLLRALWTNGIRKKQEVEALATEIENKEHMVIKRKDQIFED